MTPFYVYFQHHTAMAITRSMTTVQKNNTAQNNYSAASKKVISQISTLSPTDKAYILCEIGKMILDREKKEKAVQENKKD